jgi:hypothetical protein
VVFGFIICVKTYGHQNEEQDGIVNMKPFWKPAHQQSDEKYIKQCERVKCFLQP